MAKQRREHTASSAISSLLSVIDKVAQAELGNLSEAEQIEANAAGLAAVKDMTALVGESNVMTAMENLDDNIELQHQIAEQLEAEQAEQDDDDTETREDNM